MALEIRVRMSLPALFSSTLSSLSPTFDVIQIERYHRDIIVRIPKQDDHERRVNKGRPRKRILQVIIVNSLLLQASTSNYQTSKQQQRFREAIEYWTETICTLQTTKTFVFHGIFANSTRMLKDFFEVLLYTTAEYCNAIVLVKVYSLSNFRQDYSSNMTNLNNTEQSIEYNTYQSARVEDCDKRTKIREYNVIKREKNGSIWRLPFVVNVLRRKWNIRRWWRENDEYYTDIWTLNVIFLGDCNSFERLLDSNTIFEWNSREHFIVLAVWNDLLAGLSDRKPLIDRTLRKLWLEYQIHNVFFDEPLSSHRGFNLYSRDPFAVNAWGQLESVDGTSKRGMLRSLSTLTYRRAVNFNGYRFNVSIFDQAQEGTKIRDNINPKSIYVYSGGYGGPSGILLGVLAKKLNFTVNVIEPNTKERYGHLMENGTLSGAVGDVAYHRVVASFASFFVKKYVDDMSSIEFTTAVGFDQVCVIVPKATKIPKGLRMFYIFESSVWLCMMLSYILVYLTWHYVQVFSPNRSIRVDNEKMVFQIFVIAIGYQSPLPSAYAERYVLIGLAFSSITLIGMFSSILYKSFTTDMFYADIENLAELDASGLPIGFYSYSTTDIFGSDNNPDLSPMLQRLQKKMVHETDAVTMAAFHRNISGFLRDEYFSLEHNSLIDKTGTYLVHRVAECPARFYLACLLPSNSFLRERINVMIGRLNQAGLPSLWRTHSVIRTALKLRVNIQNDHKRKEETSVAFQLSDLQISFFILVTGLLLSTIVFFNEKGWIRLCFRKTRSDSVTYTS